MFNIFRKKYSYEELLVQKVMINLKKLQSTNPFYFLAIPFTLNLGNEEKKVITYIFEGNNIYVDDQQKINTDNKDLDFKRYCFQLNGKFKNFFELEKYEFLFINMKSFIEEFNNVVRQKKSEYGI